MAARSTEDAERQDPSISEESEPEAPTISLKDKTKDIDVFFHPSEKVGGKPQRACIICK